MTERHKGDFYVTPDHTIRAIFEAELCPVVGEMLVDAGAGTGAITRVAEEYGYRVLAVELNPDLAGQIIPPPSGGLVVGDYLTWEPDESLRTQVQAVVMNPPYSQNLEFVERSLELFPRADVAALLRLSFLGSQDRYPFHRKHGVRRLYPIANRPSFTGGGTDNSEYAWFVWSSHGYPGIRVLNTYEYREAKAS